MAVAPIAPTALKCLRCQLLGRRNLTCTRAAQCSDLPMSFAVGPVLVLGWALTAIAFLIAVS